MIETTTGVLESASGESLHCCKVGCRCCPPIPRPIPCPSPLPYRENPFEAVLEKLTTGDENLAASGPRDWFEGL